MSVYPRWRGEHDLLPPFAFSHGGLSPLARGTRDDLPLRVRNVRFIPAGAGNTKGELSRIAAGAVYPRWRGEHAAFLIRFAGLAGLSPLARGTPWRRLTESNCHRFIPAGAGNTPHSLQVIVRFTVYPRWRGEHTKHTYLFLNNFISHQQSTN